MNGIEARAPGFSFRELEESLSKALPAMGGINCDVVNEKSFVVNGEDDYPHDGSAAFGDGYSTIGDDLCVIVGHRARQHPDALDVVPVRGVNKFSHPRRICPSSGSERILNHCSTTGSFYNSSLLSLCSIVLATLAGGIV